MKLKVGEAVDIQADKRYMQHIRGHAMGDVYDALVELITNSDDSYNRLCRQGKIGQDGGSIVVGYLEQRKGEPSYLVVSDNAEGMNSDDMDRSLRRIGAYVSAEGNRGYMGRGAKDCTELGELTYESVKDSLFYRCKLTPDLKFVLEVDGKPAGKNLRQRVGIPEGGNGTKVTLQLGDNVRLPRFDNIATDLPWHFSLRDIASANAASSLFLQKIKDGDPQRLVFRPPEGQLVVDEKYPIPGYEGAFGWLRIWRADEPLDESRPRFERCGLIVKGARAIHECSLLVDELKRNPHARKYFGRIDCPYLDRLMQEYEIKRKGNQQHPQENPSLILDPNRRHGLERRHPFVQALLDTPVIRLKALVAKDIDEEKAQQREVASEETKARLDKLARLAGRFLRDELEEIDLAGDGEDVDPDAFAKRGAVIYPTYLNLAVGKERSLTLYVHRSAIRDVSRPISIVSDNDQALEIDESPFVLRPHRDKEDRLVAVFKARGLQVCSGVVLTAVGEGLPKAEAYVQVVPSVIEQHDFRAPLEFEREEYHVRLGKRKTIRLFAQYPEVVATETRIEIKSEDNDKVAVRGKCVLRPVVGSNYAEASITIEGKTLRARTRIVTEVGSHRAATAVRVIDTREEEGVPLRFEIRDQDFGNFRAMWATLEGKPNLLLISARHKSVARYLGPHHEAQETPHFRVLLAEIIAEMVCRRLLTEEARLRPRDFEFSSTSHEAIEEVFGFFARRMREFLPKAHAAMLSDAEVRTAQAVPE